MKVSEFLENKINPFVLGAFLSRYIITRDKKHIVTVSSFRKSSKVGDDLFMFEGYYEKYTELINNESLPNNEWILRENVPEDVQLPVGNIFFILDNDINLDENSFYNNLYRKLMSSCPWVHDEKFNDEKKAFIRGFMELRGSIDTQRDYISQDYYFNSKFELKKAWILIDHMDLPYYVVNINFRELQNQYYTGENQRNTQLRFELFWYMQNIGIINEYKAKIFEITRNIESSQRKSNIIFFHTNNFKEPSSEIIYSRINYYVRNLLNREISDEEISQLRSSLGFDAQTKTLRSKALVDMIMKTTPDECMSCKDIYDISDRSFLRNNSEEYYFEIHHMISLGDNKELDDEDNLVKLCPICHRNLKRGTASADSQKDIIKRIYQNAPNVLAFAKHFFNTEDFDEIIEKTYENLK